MRTSLAHFDMLITQPGFTLGIAWNPDLVGMAGPVKIGDCCRVFLRV